MVRSFEYRHPRLHTSFALDFHTADQVLHGQCTDVSSGGLNAVFAEGTKVSLGASGSLVLRHPLRQFTLDASVAHLDGEHVGLVFVGKSAAERLASEQFSSLVSSNSSRD